jgi:hypothetical protein
MKKVADSKIVDLRLLERNLDNGTLSKKDYDAYQSALPDDSDNAEYSAITMEDVHADSSSDYDDDDDEASE